jgi:hypothetical protein
MFVTIFVAVKRKRMNYTPILSLEEEADCATLST